MAEQKINSTLTALFRQAQTVITFGYLSMVAVGMLYYHQKYSEFGINIFQYADIFYFLVAPFEDSFIFLLCGLAIAIFAVGYWFDGFSEHRFPRVHAVMNLGMNKKPWFDAFNSFSWPFTFILLIVIYSQVYGESSRDAVLESEPVTVTFAEGLSSSGLMIGKTNDMLFLLESGKVKVIPLNSMVQEITIGTFAAPDLDSVPDPDPDPDPDPVPGLESPQAPAPTQTPEAAATTTVE